MGPSIFILILRSAFMRKLMQTCSWGSVCIFANRIRNYSTARPGPWPFGNGSGLSCRDATGANTMAETIISASALALHLDCSRAYIGKLEAEGVIRRQGDSFPLDQNRVAYLRHLRREHQRSPRTQAD